MFEESFMEMSTAHDIEYATFIITCILNAYFLSFVNEKADYTKPLIFN